MLEIQIYKISFGTKTMIRHKYAAHTTSWDFVSICFHNLTHFYELIFVYLYRCTLSKMTSNSCDQSINNWASFMFCNLVWFRGHDNANAKVESKICQFLEIEIQNAHIASTFDKYHFISVTKSGGISVKIWLYFEALLRILSHIVSYEIVAPQLVSSSPWNSSITHQFNLELKDGKAKLFAPIGQPPCELATFQSVWIQISRSFTMCLWHWVVNGVNIALLKVRYIQGAVYQAMAVKMGPSRHSVLLCHDVLFHQVKI